MIRRELTLDDVSRIVAWLSTRYGFVVRDRRKSEVMEVVGTILQAFGVLSKKEFDSGFCTTLLKYMYLDFVPGTDDGGYSPVEQLVLVVHEATHVAQWNRDGVGYVARFLISTSERAIIETEAYAAGSTMQFACSGQLITGDFVYRALGDYACPEASRQTARISMDSNNAVIAQGGHVGEVAQEALRFMSTLGL